MDKWEYCKIIDPIRVPGKAVEPAKLLYLGALEANERVEEIENAERTLAQLGLEGWELISHSQVSTVIDRGTALPVLEVYYLKRGIGESR
jgi:hypothetical protein